MSKIVLPNGMIFHEGGVSPEDEHKFYSGTVKSVLRPRRQRQVVLRQEEKDRRQPAKQKPPRDNQK